MPTNFALDATAGQEATSYRISPLRAVYLALDAGLKTDKDPERTAENELLSLAARPGLDIEGGDVYAVAMSHAKLAGILAAALRSAWQEPWKQIAPTPTWESACYDAGDGHIRRIALVDRWSGDRKQQEIGGWRTLGEVCALNRTVLVTAITIGTSQDKRRHSAWTRCFRHPRNRTIRFQKRSADEEFSANWEKAWREDAGIKTADWLKMMKEDGCMTDLVHTVQVPVPRGRDAYLKEMERIAGEMAGLPEVPPMRLAGCHGFSPCPFLSVCPDTDPKAHGFKLLA